MGHEAGWGRKVGKDEVGKAMLSFFRGEGVDGKQVLVEDTVLTGMYFKEIRGGSQVIVQYYRKGSAASQ